MSVREPEPADRRPKGPARECALAAWLRWRPLVPALLAAAATSALAVMGASAARQAPSAPGAPSASRAALRPESGAAIELEVMGLDRRLALRVPADLPKPLPAPVAAARGTRSEDELYAEFLALAEAEPGALERLGPALLVREGQACEQVAYLRALHSIGSPLAGELFATAIAELADSSSPEAESVPRFALRFLVARAACEPWAGAGLERAAFGAAQPDSSELRALAAAALAALAPEGELWRIASRLAVEPDPNVRRRGIEALAAGPQAIGAAPVLELLGLELPPLPAPEQEAQGPPE